jgi:hypothetical protein
MLAHTYTFELGSPQNIHTTDSALWVNEYTKDSYNERKLPLGFPKELATKLAWHGTDLAKKLTYIYDLTDNDRLEIDCALDSFYRKNHIRSVMLINTDHK